jgi:DNA repair protein SbcC/Rad50
VKPRRLVVEGFGALRDRLELDFRDADFFALVGPTGAGKSTVIDAICFALYGAIPRYDDSRLVTAAISAQALTAQVDLEFDRGDERYRIVRTVRRAGQNKMQLDHLDRDGALIETIASSARDVKTAIVDIVGLDFDQFTKCVVLPQGAFSALLHESEAKRNELLVRLLDLGVYDRIGKLAGQRATALANEISIASETLSRLRAVTDDELAAANARRSELLELFAACKELLDLDRTHELDAQAARDAAAAARRAALALSAVAIPEHLAASVDQATQANIDLAAATQALDAAEAAADTAERASADSPARSDLDRGVAAYEALDRARTAAEKHRIADAEAITALDLAQQALDAALAVRDAAVNALESVRRTEAAHALAEHLRPGDDCPVCERPIDALPTRSTPVELTAAAHDLELAQTALDLATTEHRSSDRRRAATETELASALAGLATVEAEVANLPTLAEIHRDLAAITQLELELTTARARMLDARQAVQRTRAAVDDANRRVGENEQTYATQREAIARAGVSDLPASSGVLADDWTALAAWAVDAKRTHEADATASEHAASTHERRRRDLVDPLRDRLAALDIDLPAGATLSSARDRVHEAGIEARKDVEEFERAREQARELRDRLPAAEQQLEVARELHRHLGAKRFESWLLRRALDELAERASIRLAELSSERYALALGDKGEFVVIDQHHGGEARPARSLSGGETFQASLALALALAEQVADLSPIGATALESIFLDEGFGTLDPEALEVVAGTIEQLGAGERMVGIVTHVAALAERVPVRFRVGGDRRSATITREPPSLHVSGT